MHPAVEKKNLIQEPLLYLDKNYKGQMGMESQQYESANENLSSPNMVPPHRNPIEDAGNMDNNNERSVILS